MHTKRYIEGPDGQVHLHQWGSGPDCIICLAPAPYSGIAFYTLAPELARTHRVIAMDYPGYGQSAPTRSTPTIGDYADAALAVADALSPTSSVTLLGFHTGTLVAIEAAIRKPARIENTVLVDVPFFDPRKRGELLIKMGAVRALTPQLSMLESDWNFSVVKRLEHVPLARGYELFVDQISGGERCHSAFHAAFSYPCEARFGKMSQRSLVVATGAGLHRHTCAAAGLLASATLMERPDIEVAVLDNGAEAVAQMTLEWLEGQRAL